MGKTTIGAALKAARLDAGMSQRDLAKATGLALGQISQLESGVRGRPSFDIVAKVAVATGASLDAIAAAVGFAVNPEANGPTSGQMAKRIERAHREAQALADDLASIAAKRPKN